MGRKDDLVILIENSCFVWYWLFPVTFLLFLFYFFFLPSLCMNFHSGANAGAITLYSLARFFLNKSHICIFISKYLLFKWYASLSSYGSTTEIFLLGRGYSEWDQASCGRGEAATFFVLFWLVFFLVDLSRSISEDGRFLKTKWMCLGILHTSMLNYY